MAIRLTRNRTDSGTITITFEDKQLIKFAHKISRQSQVLPLAGNEQENNPESAAMIFDTGGVVITYSITIKEKYSDYTTFINRYKEIDNFFSNVPIMTGITFEFDENGWTIADSTERHTVLKDVEILRNGGELYIIQVNIMLLGGQVVG